MGQAGHGRQKQRWPDIEAADLDLIMNHASEKNEKCLFFVDKMIIYPKM